MLRSITRLTLGFATSIALSPAVAHASVGQGSVSWSQQTSGAASIFPPALGPYGDVYTTNGGSVTAFSSDGSFLWSVPIDGATGPVSVGPDGTIYTSVGPVGANPTILALEQDGSEKWTFTADGGIVAGPNVGPDGRIYAVANTVFGGEGFFALDAEGNQLWNEVGSPPLTADTGQPHEILFGDGVAYLAMTPDGGSNGDPPLLWAFDLDGAQAFVLNGSCQGQPVVDAANGRLITGNGLCQSVEVRDGATGSLLWSEDPPSQSPCSGLAEIAVGPDGNIYTAFCYRAFWSLDPNGNERWFDDDFSLYFQMRHFAVSPDNAFVLDLGGDVGQPGRVRAFDTQTAALRWQVDLDHASQRASARPAFDASGDRMYFNVNRFGADTSDVFVIDLGGSACSADADGSGAVDVSDMLVVLAGWGPCGASCPADLDGSGNVDVADLLLLLASWGACE